MTTMTTKPLQTLLDENNLIPPSQKDEDWLTYDLDALLSISTQSSEPSKKPTITIVHEYYIYILNGNIVSTNLPETLEKNVVIEQKQTNNAFIQLARSNSECVHLDFTGLNDIEIGLYIECSAGCANSMLQINATNTTGGLIKRYFKVNDGALINHYTNINVANDSTITMSDTNNNNTGHILDFVDVSVAKNAHYYALNQSYLSNNSRFQNRVTINGEDSDATLHGLAINEEKQSCFYNTHIYHDTEDSVSNQLFKSMLKKDATLEYNGKVSVLPHAQQTNSYQLNQNILLDETANVYSRPQLFIDADDVKCTHGSTTGDINRHEVLYLMSRGLDELTSRKIVLNAFFEEVFDKPTFKPEQQNVHAILDKIL